MCRILEVGVYLCKVFSNKVVIIISAILSWCFHVLFPTTQYLYGAVAIFAMILIDLFTRLFALKRTSGGWAKAFLAHKINSKSFARGTVNKLIVFMVLMIMGACAYQLMIIKDIAIWFTQFIFVVLFLTEGISILENLLEAGCNVSIFSKILKKKLNKYTESCGAETTETVEKPTETVENNNSVL